MLQIEIEEQNPAEQLFTVCGELVGERAKTLIGFWDEHKVVGKGRINIMDVSGITSIDQIGESVIRHLDSEGARFQVSGPIIGNVIDQVCKEKRRALKDGHREFTSIVFCLRP